MAKAASPAATDLRKLADRSKEATLALDPASLTAATAGSPAKDAPRHITVSMAEFEARAAFTLALISVGSFLVGTIVTLLPKPSAKPLQRKSSATLPTS